MSTPNWKDLQVLYPAVALWSSSSCPVWIWDLLLTLTTPTSVLQKVTSPAQKSKRRRSSGGSRRAELRLDLCLCDPKPLRQLAGYFQKMQPFFSPQSWLGLVWSAPRAVSLDQALLATGVLCTARIQPRLWRVIKNSARTVWPVDNYVHKQR